VWEIFVFNHLMPDPFFHQNTPKEFVAKARLKMKRFLSPQPPKCFGFASISQLQRCIPCSFLPPVQRKSKINLRIFVRTDTGTAARAIQYTDCVSKTAFARVHRPPSDNQRLHQCLILFSNFMISHLQSSKRFFQLL
jgi:hypothetical protein